MALMDEAKPTTILKRDALGRVTLPRAQREALLDEFERSGLPATRFARAAGINYQTFACWAQQRRHVRGSYAQMPMPSAVLRFLEVVPPSTAPADPTLAAMTLPASAATLEVRLPGGASMLVTDSTQAALAAQILRSLHTSC
jgi:hypothetical protein